MEKKRFFYLKNTLIFSVLLFLFISIPPVFASQLNQTLTYDGNGNLITGDGKYREYNEFNQLLRVYDGSYPNGTILESYLYHPTENRILIKYGDYGSTNPSEAVVYVNKDLEKTYTTLSGTPRTNYTYYTFDENGLVGQITKNNTNATLRILYYHNDYSGSVSLITNSSGNIVEQTFYAPFGDIILGGDASRYSYEGKEFSSVTEDFDFHFRKYDPSLMIFSQPDSVIANVYDPQTLNRYSFEKNNPYKYNDEDGQFAILAAMGVAAIVGAVVGMVFYGLAVRNGDLSFSLKGLAGYAVGGAVGASIGVLAVVAAEAVGGIVGTVILVTGGSVSSIFSQGISNYGVDKPVTEDLGKAAIFGGLTGGMSKYLPKAGNYRINYFTSYFKTKTGGNFIANTISSETTYNIFTNLLINSGNQNQPFFSGITCDSYGCQSTAFPSSDMGLTNNNNNNNEDSNDKNNQDEDYCSNNSAWFCYT